MSGMLVAQLCFLNERNASWCDPPWLADGGKTSNRAVENFRVKSRGGLPGPLFQKPPTNWPSKPTLLAFHSSHQPSIDGDIEEIMQKFNMCLMAEVLRVGFADGWCQSRMIVHLWLVSLIRWILWLAELHGWRRSTAGWISWPDWASWPGGPLNGLEFGIEIGQNPRGSIIKRYQFLLIFRSSTHSIFHLRIPSTIPYWYWPTPKSL